MENKLIYSLFGEKNKYQAAFSVQQSRTLPVMLGIQVVESSR